MLALLMQQKYELALGGEAKLWGYLKYEKKIWYLRRCMT